VGRIVVSALVVLPVAAAAVGFQQYQATVRTAQAQTRTWHLVTAHLLTDATVPASSEAGVGQVPVAASWTTPDGAIHGATVLAWHGQAVATPVQVWIGPDGSRTAAPATRAQATLRGFQFAGATAAEIALLCVALWNGSRLALDRYRYRRCEAKWMQAEPGWSRLRPGRPG
jgi:hypothetical protein